MEDGRCFGAGDNSDGQLGVPGFEANMAGVGWLDGLVDGSLDQFVLLAKNKKPNSTIKIKPYFFQSSKLT